MQKKYYRWLAKWRLIHRYVYLNEVNKVLDVWEEVGKLPASVKREEKEDSVSISFE